MSTIKIDLLRKVADHLINGKLEHQVFDFSNYNINCGFDELPRSYCGTNGCAIGECPIIFPDDWEFKESGAVGLISMNENSERMDLEIQSGQSFFRLSFEQYIHLFVSESQNPLWVEGADPNEEEDPETESFSYMLHSNATKEEVAANILHFCNLVEKGEITNG